MLLPHLRTNPAVELAAVATTKALSGLNAQRKFGFGTMTTDVEAVLDDKTLDAVFIVTRHHSHASLVCQALERGLTVFVEKPLALTEEQLAAIVETVAKTGNNRVMVGFNRRFAPLFTDLHERFGTSTGPMSARYLVNAGRLDAKQLVSQRGAGGIAVCRRGRPLHRHSQRTGRAPPGRGVRGRAPGGEPARHAALCRRVRGHDLLRHRRQLTFPEGDPRRDRRTAATGGWTTSSGSRCGRPRVRAATGCSPGQDKGQRAQLDRFVDAVRTGSAMPITLESLVATTRATLAVGSSLASGKPVAW